MEQFRSILCLLFLASTAIAQNRICPRLPSQRRECGSPGITRNSCLQRGCCYDRSVLNTYWCFHRIDPAAPNKRNIAIQYKESCLFHCTSVISNGRIQCGYTGISEQNCVRAGCCFDTRENARSYKRCYRPDTRQVCPAPQCQIPNGKLNMCAGYVSKAYCESQGCCSAFIGRNRYCYKKEDIPAPPTTTAETTTTLPPTTTTTQGTTASTRRPSFLEILRRQNGGTLKGFSIHDMLTKSIRELMQMRRKNGDSERLNPFSHINTKPIKTTTTTTVATTTRYTTAMTSTTTPMTRVMCNLFRRCWTVTAAPTRPTRVCEPTDCGKVYFYPGSTVPPPSLKKIVGGTRAHPFSHPWTAMLLKKEGERTFVCGAVIICKYWLVTSAHCMNSQIVPRETPDLDAIFYTIYVGRYTGWKKKYGKQVQVFKGREGIDYMEQHELYVPGQSRGVITNDIGVIRLKRPIKFDMYAQPVCLPQAESPIGRMVWASGWGINKNRGPDDSALKQVAKQILNKTVCEEEVPRYNASSDLGLICAGGERFQDTCTGDSGGPLVGWKRIGFNRRGIEIRRWELIGLTSLGSPSCNTLLLDRQPALYTDIKHYLPWIRARTHRCCRED